MIELLTVIAIIGILAAILIPVVGNVREQAKASLCSSHLREIGVAAILYAQENNDFYPPARATYIASLEPSTRDAFDTYADGGYEIFYCPNEGVDNPDRTTFDPYESWTTIQGSGYIIGYFWFGNPTVPGSGDPDAIWIDSRRTGTTSDEYLLRVTDPDASLIAIAADQTNQGAGAGNWIMRHPEERGGSMNVLYGDGHIERKTASEVRPRWYRPSPVGW